MFIANRVEHSSDISRSLFLVEGDRRRGVLEEHVGLPDHELPELRHLPHDLASDEMASSRRSGDGYRSLSPGLLPGLNLQGPQTRGMQWVPTICAWKPQVLW